MRKKKTSVDCGYSRNNDYLCGQDMIVTTKLRRMMKILMIGGTGTISSAIRSLRHKNRLKR